MIRDLDLVRKILLEIESQKNGPNSKAIKIEGYSQEEIDYHLSIMYDAGLFSAATANRCGPNYRLIIPTGLTWAGHDFLDACRDEKRWTKAKEIVAKMGTGVTFEVLKTILVQIMTSQIPKF
jgi:hypothetical protein